MSTAPFPSVARTPPDAHVLRDVLHTHYALAGTLRLLPGYADQNVLLTTPEGMRYVLKVASDVPEDALLAQVAAHAHLAAAGLPVPAVVPTHDGKAMVQLPGPPERYAHLLTFLPGVLLTTVRPLLPTLLRHVGSTLGRLTAALADFEHPGIPKTHDWELGAAPGVIRDRLAFLDDDTRPLVEQALACFEDVDAARCAGLRRSALHGDANRANLLVSSPDQPERHVTGVLDLGDLVYGWTAGELAIALTYLLMDADDLLTTAQTVVGAYHATFSLEEDEVATLYGLITLRLGVTLCKAAESRHALAPDDPALAYRLQDEAAARTLLRQLLAMPPALVHYALRAACGWEPYPTAPALTAWLRAHPAAPVLPLSVDDAIVFDFSPASLDWDADALGQPMLAADALADRIAEAGAAVGIGRYDEPRLVYAADQFEDATGERRTVHIGLDLFAPAGTPVCAPFDGTVHSLQDNGLPLDYGPTILLEHTPPDGPAFYTLYGHLSKASLDGLKPGMPVAAGQPIGTLGAPEENGGWAPHLHLQVIGDLLGYVGDFPGVAPTSQRALWTSLCPDPNLLVGVPPDAFPPPAPTAEMIQAARTAHIAPSLSLSYSRPLHLVRGIGAYLYDAEGRAYLDGVNNVAHVGHGHPQVVAALRQAAVLNTNTRYLHEKLVRYAERLAALFPDPLQVCFFVNSGSEANDLALRLAFAHTGRRDVIVLDGAYHGHTHTLIGISPYKFDGAGGNGCPPTTHIVPMPDAYRGRYRGPDTGAQYATHVAQAVQAAEARGGVAAFLAESLLGCGGQIELPNGFLQKAYEPVRAAGGVCIADEVQVGFGRVGSHRWGFETQGVVPDIVTLGKPIGNGHPLGAVVTTPEIAASFANGMEYFNTFGGNPVSCAVGLAVLDVLRDDNLQAHAAEVGTALRTALARLADRHPIIGDVRGRGLFLGIELVRDRRRRTPAPEAARYAVDRMRDHGILLSTDGPAHNVIKIKPPLAFGLSDASRLAATLDRVLGEDIVRAQVA